MQLKQKAVFASGLNNIWGNFESAIHYLLEKRPKEKHLEKTYLSLHAMSIYKRCPKRLSWITVFFSNLEASTFLRWL